MSILSQFFQGRHNNQDVNQTLASIFSQQYNAPKLVPPPSNPTKKQKNIKHPQKQSASFDEDRIQPGKTINQLAGIDSIKAKRQGSKQKKVHKKSGNGEVRQDKKGKKIQVTQQEAEGDDEVEKKEQPENLESTVFVGNIPLESTHQSVKKYFQKFGKVIKVWFRSIPVEQSKIPKKGLHILKKYQEGADSMNAYVKYQKIEEATAACAANGQTIGQNNIKVTLCKQFDLDYETTIFIGNLPRKIKDQELWDTFKSIGTVKSVRVIRNKQNFESIGIGYVRFETKDEMKKAISEMNGKKIGDRPMRIKKAVSKERLQKKVRKVKQNKEKKFKKSHQIQKTGKGTRSKETEQNQFKITNLKNSNYDKTKPISKKPREFKTRDFEKKPFSQKKDQVQNRQSNQIIRTKFGFHGKKILLE